MIYQISELTVTPCGNKWRNKYYFEDREKALYALKCMADKLLEGYKNGHVKESWIDLEEMIADTYGYERYEGEMYIDGDSEPIALQYIDLDADFIDTPLEHLYRRGIDY